MADPRKRYGKLPAEVLCDQNLSDKATRLYGIIAMHAFQGATASIGVRRLSQFLPGATKSEVHRRLKELATLKYIQIRKAANGQRSIYFLPSPIFGQRQGRETVIRSSPKGSRMVSVALEDVA